MTVIVPVYNVEPYLAECLDSVLKQTLHNIEVICIDDGSPDDSGRILADYAARDSRIRVLRQENAGLSATRNKGLDEARAPYVYFLDGDDTIEHNALELLTDLARANDLDIVLFDGDARYEEEDLRASHPMYIAYYNSRQQYSEVVDGASMLAALIEHKDFRPSACLQLTRVAHLRDARIRFVEGIIHEDNLFTVQSLLAARRVAHTSEVLFHRRVRSDSIMTSAVGLDNFVGYFTCMCRMIALFQTETVPPHAIAALEERIRAMRKSALTALRQVPRKKLETAPWEHGTIERVMFDLMRPTIAAASQSTIRVRPSGIKGLFRRIIPATFRHVDRRTERLEGGIRSVQASLVAQQGLLAELEAQSERVLNGMDTQRRAQSEALWAHTFEDSARGVTWLEGLALSPGRWAVGYPHLYILLRALESAHPRNMLDLGLGQSSRMIARYVEANPEARHVAVEHDQEWLTFFQAEFALGSRTRILRLPLQKREFLGSETTTYAGFPEAVSGEKFDLISVDGPFGYDAKKYARVDIVELIPECLAPSFVILVDDYERPGEQRTVDLIKRRLEASGIPYAAGVYEGMKRTCAIVSADLSFLRSL